MTQMSLFMKQKPTHGHREDLRLPRGADGRVMEWQSGISRCKLLYVEWINSKVLLGSTGNYIQYPVIPHTRKEYFLKKCVCVCVSHSVVSNSFQPHRL